MKRTREIRLTSKKGYLSSRLFLFIKTFFLNRERMKRVDGVVLVLSRDAWQ